MSLNIYYGAFQGGNKMFSFIVKPGENMWFAWPERRRKTSTLKAQ
jgi:hypothetical protein